MKTSTLDTLIVAKSIHQEVKRLIHSGDKHTSTAAIILLQDFVELVVLACLDELDVDEQRSLESKSFDELLGELKKQKVPIYKSGTIKALNKQRVICKHYGQLSEPSSVANYFNVAGLFVDKLLTRVVGSKLSDIFLTDLIKSDSVKRAVLHAITLSENKKYFEALVKLRKVFFREYEKEYCIYPYANVEKDSFGLLGLLGIGRGGQKAHYWMRNKDWISKNVNTPLDFVQIHIEQMKSDCMEIGFSTVDMENFRRLTPDVVETEHDVWHLEVTPSQKANLANLENFNYCLELLLDFLLKSQKFNDGRRFPANDKEEEIPTIYIGHEVYNRPSKESEMVGLVKAHHRYSVHKIVDGFISGERYLQVSLYPEDNKFELEDYINGYLLFEPDSECESD